jgi:hypothetical protein
MELSVVGLPTVTHAIPMIMLSQFLDIIQKLRLVTAERASGAFR